MADKDNKKKVILGGIFLGAIPLLFVIYLVLGPILSILQKDLTAEEMYVISDGVNVRSKAEANSLKMGRVNYGTKLLVYKIEEEWAEVLIEGQKGYVSKNYIGTPETYYMLEGLFGDERSKKRVNKTQYRLAVLRYLNEKGYLTRISDEYKEFFEDEDLNKEVFQIFSEPGKSRYNSTAYGDFDGDFVWDAAFVLKNPDTEKKLLIILSFDKNDPLSKSRTLFEMELEEPWIFIRRSAKGNRWYLKNQETEPDMVPKKTKIKIDGIGIGTNRNKNLNDPVNLLLYNGEEFEIHEQDK
ncbi:MAG: SH3 domain-containing protein [Bacteroidota bacterium]